MPVPSQDEKGGGKRVTTSLKNQCSADPAYSTLLGPRLVYR